jgi:hypothetical protein
MLRSEGLLSTNDCYSVSEMISLLAFENFQGVTLSLLGAIAFGGLLLLDQSKRLNNHQQLLWRTLNDLEHQNGKMQGRLEELVRDLEACIERLEWIEQNAKERVSDEVVSAQDRFDDDEDDFEEDEDDLEEEE